MLRNSDLSDHGAPFAEAGGLLEGARHLQHAEVFFVPSDYLHADRKPFRGEAARHRGRRITGRRYVPAGFHPVDVAIELHAGDLRGIGRADVEWGQLRGGQNEVLVSFEERLKASP